MTDLQQREASDQTGDVLTAEQLTLAYDQRTIVKNVNLLLLITVICL